MLDKKGKLQSNLGNPTISAEVLESNGYREYGQLQNDYGLRTWQKKATDGNGIKYNSIYDRGAVRCGCQPCTAYCSWQERLSRENFKLYIHVQHLQGNMLLEDYQKLKLNPKTGKETNDR